MSYRIAECGSSFVRRGTPINHELKWKGHSNTETFVCLVGGKILESNDAACWDGDGLIGRVTSPSM